jgi:hypothetical protein
VLTTLAQLRAPMEALVSAHADGLDATAGLAALRKVRCGRALRAARCGTVE